MQVSLKFLQICSSTPDLQEIHRGLEMKLKKFLESEQTASRQMNRNTFSVYEPLTKSEIAALRRKKKLICEELQKKVESHFAKLMNK